MTFYKGKGCATCGLTGFKGRVGIFEILEVNGDMRDLIIKAPRTLDIWNLARKQGMATLFEDGLEKVKSGMTTLEELIRVAPPTA
jgi:type II secretory ATPase GspE/PulE/Tfp pilus assembly ATPase PilB-like protein